MAAGVQFVTFRLGEEQFGVPIGAAQEIVRLSEVTPVPEAPWFVEGVINLRGRIIPVIDLGRRLRLPDRPRTRKTRILIVEMDRRQVGLIVDAASEVLRLPPNAVEPPPPMISGIGVEYITGVGKLGDQLLVLLDLAKVLHPEDLRRAEAAGLPAAGARPDAVAVPANAA
jgi:purine-binding chemotaxis protein CheW